MRQCRSRPSNASLSTLVALALAITACGGSTTIEPAGGSGAGGSGASSGSSQDTTSTSTGGSNGDCPPAEPASGTVACTKENMRCTYGDSVRPECRHDWTCLEGQWRTTKSVCIEPPAEHCAFDTPPADVVCPGDFEGDVCTIGNTICVCSTCGFGGPCMAPPPHWFCGGPPTTPGCPPTVPNDGTQCSEPGLECIYGLVCSGSGAFVICDDGAWHWDREIGCPTSG